MEQSQGRSSLKINVTRTYEVTTMARTTEEDITPLCLVTAFSPRGERQLARWRFSTDQYTLVRLSNAGDGDILEKLDTNIGTGYEVLSIEELIDGSWEMVTLKSYCCTLQDTLSKMFPGSNVDLNYDPLEPTASDVEYVGHNTAKKLCQYWFLKRAERMIQVAWPMAAAYYACLVERMNGPKRLSRL